MSNSYGAPEWSDETQLDPAYDHPGVAIVASAGDSGYGVSYPAASPGVIAVGGTNLVQTTNDGVRNATETVWPGTGSGCSAYEPKPAWQTDTGCPRRTVSDVSAVADPSTGVWVYDSADGGWEVFGGTSVAAPIIGAVYALAGNGPSTDELGSSPYAAGPGALNDVVSGSNGSCGPAYLCTGASGYDGPTGLGTPNSAAFAASAADVNPTPPPPPPPPAPDFAVAASMVAAVRAGSTATGPVTISPQNGFSGAVQLSASVSPGSGLTPSFSPSSVTVGGAAAGSTLKLVAHTGGTYTVTVTAKQGALVHRTSVTVAVNDFSMQVSPAKATVARAAGSCASR